ncbi:MAG: N-acetyl-gamma-glutamyl-phosphate reductase [Ignavibacteriaceae bacterium]|nr:N-acetyl-gamma-glutamyl-phosphate reductase [Ignavibacteriaceae bacterium]
MISVGIIGGSGYTGKYLVQFCNNHPNIESISIYGHSTAGKTICQVFPELLNQVKDSIIMNSKDISFEHDVYFIALPHGEALNFVPGLIEKNKIVIDLGGDYRLDDKHEYAKWYKTNHSSPELLSNKTYGLADFYDSSFYQSSLIANPGCYPTASLLGLLPLTKRFYNKIISASTSAYSGTSGAGKSANADLSLSEMDGNVRAYNINAHRHQPEIEQTLHKFGFASPYSFTTHLLPACTGIYATTTVFLDSDMSKESIQELYTEQYAGSSFVRIRNTPPNLRWVINTNFCDINVNVNKNTIVITSAIDNLIKGASGQAVQNLNKIFNWEESAGLLKGAMNVSVY